VKHPVVLVCCHLLAGLLVSAPSPGDAATLLGVGDLPGGLFVSEAYAISADGSTVVGRSESAAGTEAFVWTTSGGIVGLGDLAGGEFFSQATGVSDDGQVVVGGGRDAAGEAAFRWTAPGGIEPLCAGQALDVSGDGSVVVGQANLRALRWTSTSGCDVFDMEDAYGYEAVSSLGDVAAGRSRPNEALRWTEASGFQLLGDLQTGPAEFRISEAYGISSGALRAGLFAQRHPERVARLALDAFVWTGEGSPTLEARRKNYCW